MTDEFDHTHLCSYCATPYGCNKEECQEEDAELFGLCSPECESYKIYGEKL